jgi:hypothetical protein
MLAGNPTHLFRTGPSTVCGIPTNVSTPDYPVILSDSPLNTDCGLCLSVLLMEIAEAEAHA